MDRMRMSDSNPRNRSFSHLKPKIRAQIDLANDIQLSKLIHADEREEIAQ